MDWTRENWGGNLVGVDGFPGFPAGGAGPRRPAFDMPSGTAAQWAPELRY